MDVQTKILFLYPLPVKNITGGHKYENRLRTVLSKKFNLRVKSLFAYDNLTTFDKIIAPFKALSLLMGLRRNELVVFNSTTGMYFLLLINILRMCGYKTAVIHHHYLAQEFTGRKGKIYGFVEKSFLRAASHVITPSPYVKDLIFRQLKRDAALIPIPFSAPKQVKAAPKEGQLLYIGTIEPRKGLDYLMNSLIKLDNNTRYKLHIIGKISNQDYYEALSDKISRHHLSVTFHGYLSDAEMSTVISKSDVFVFPSLLEGFGMAINEMRFYGLPVICFDNSALPYSVTDGVDGILVPDKDSEKLAEAIKTVVIDRPLREKLSAASFERSKHLTTMDEFSSIANCTFLSLLKKSVAPH